MKPHAGFLMEMNSPGIQAKLHTSHCENYKTNHYFFERRGAVGSLTLSCRVLDFRCVNNKAA